MGLKGPWKGSFSKPKQDLPAHVWLLCSVASFSRYGAAKGLISVAVVSSCGVGNGACPSGGPGENLSRQIFDICGAIGAEVYGSSWGESQAKADPPT